MTTDEPAVAAAEDAPSARRLVDARLDAILAAPRAEDMVGLAMRRAATGPGKRLRPVMLLLALGDLGRRPGAAALDAACALELVHTASLILDDLPCMDDSDLRRGRPTTHRAFGEDVAVLAAIALLARAYELLAGARGLAGEDRSALVAVLSTAIGRKGLVGGQLQDLRGGAADPVAMMERKTAALFVAALDMACILGEGSADCRRRLTRFGRELGVAFQILDDLMDATDAPGLGKPTLQDAGKPNLVRLHGLEAGRLRLGQHVRAAGEAVAGIAGGAPRLTGLLDLIFAPAERPGLGAAAAGAPPPAL